MSYEKDPAYLDTTVPTDTAPPSYSAATNGGSDGFQIFAAASEYLVQPKSQSKAYNSGSITTRFTVLNIKELTVISSDSADESKANFSMKSGAVRFQIEGTSGTSNKFEIPETNIPKFHNAHFNLLLKDMPPVQLQLLSSKGSEDHIWRPKVSTQESSQTEAASSSAHETSEREIVDLVLLDKDYQEAAYFTSQFDPVREKGNRVHLCGTLVFKQDKDEVFRHQATLSLIALIEAYSQLVQKSDKWNQRMDKAFGAALLCEVM